MRVRERQRLDAGGPRGIALARRHDERAVAGEHARRRRRLPMAVDDHAPRLARRRDRADRELGVVLQHGADAGEDRARPGAPRVAVGTRRVAGDPPARAVRERRSPVEARRYLRAHPRPAARHARDEADVLLARLVLAQARFDGDAGRAQALRPARRVAPGLRQRHDDPADPRGEHGVDARWRAPVVVARLQRHVHGRAAGVGAAARGVGERLDLGVRRTRARVEAFADHGAVADDHAADARVRRRRVHPARREIERVRHVRAVAVGERRHRDSRTGRYRRGRLAAGGGASTSRSASRKSDTSWNDRYTDANRM